MSRRLSVKHHNRRQLIPTRTYSHGQVGPRRAGGPTVSDLHATLRSSQPAGPARRARAEQKRRERPPPIPTLRPFFPPHRFKYLALRSAHTIHQTPTAPRNHPIAPSRNLGARRSSINGEGADDPVLVAALAVLFLLLASGPAPATASRTSPAADVAATTKASPNEVRKQDVFIDSRSIFHQYLIFVVFPSEGCGGGGQRV